MNEHDHQELAARKLEGVDIGLQEMMRIIKSIMAYVHLGNPSTSPSLGCK